MKKIHEEWLREAGWIIVSKSGFGRQRVCHFYLADRVIVSFAELVELSSELEFTPAAGINFPEFIKLAGKKLRIANMYEPYRFLSLNPSLVFIKESTDEVIKWAKSLDLKSIVEEETHLKNVNGENQWHGSLLIHLTSLAILGKTDVLEFHFEDAKKHEGAPKTEHINLMGDANIYIVRALELSKEYAKNPFFV